MALQACRLGRGKAADRLNQLRELRPQLRKIRAPRAGPLIHVQGAIDLDLQAVAMFLGVGRSGGPSSCPLYGRLIATS